MKWSRKAAVISMSPEIKYLNSQLQELGGGINTRAGELAAYCRISPMRKRFAADYIASVTIDAESREIVAKHQLMSSGEIKAQSFAVDIVFDSTCENSLIRNTLLTASDKNSAISWVWSGFNTALISYGEVDSGKSYTLFSPAKGVKSAYERSVEELFALIADSARTSPEMSGTSSYSIAVSVWELVHSQTDHCEIVSDLLRVSDVKPLPGGSGDLTSVQVNNVEEAVLLMHAAKEMSENWRTNAEGGFDCLHNRGHFFVRVLLYEANEKRVSSLHLVDLAGTLPSNLSPELRAKLGSDDQLTASRMGLNQFRSMIWELAKSDSSHPVDLAAVVSTRKSKLAQFLGPVLAGNCRTYLIGCVREDSAFADACKTLELLVQAGKICTPCMKTTGVEKTELKLTHLSILQARHRGMQVVTARQVNVLLPPRVPAKTSEVVSRPHPPVRPVTPQAEEGVSAEEEQVRKAAWLQDFSEGSPAAPRKKRPVKLESLKKEIDNALQELELSHNKSEKLMPVSPLEEDSVEVPKFVPEDPIANLESSYEAKVHKGEYFVLKRNYDSLLAVLKEQEEERMRQAAKIEDLQQEIEETKAAFEVDMETYKLENIGLKQKLRTVQEAKDWTVICDMYEEEIARLTQQVRAGRDEVIALLQQVEKTQKRDSPQSAAVDEVTVLQREHKQTLAELRNTIKKLQLQLQGMDTELGELKRQERRWKLNRKGLETISKRTGDLQTHVNKQKSQLEEMQQINEELETRLLEMREKNSKLECEVEEVVADNQRLVEDLKTMREVAVSSGLSPATVDRLHKGGPGPMPAAAKLALNLIQRLQKACASTGDKGLWQLVDNVAEEVNELVQALEATSEREQNLLHVLVDLQEKLGKQDPATSRQANKALRNSLIASLSA